LHPCECLQVAASLDSSSGDLVVQKVTNEMTKTEIKIMLLYNKRGLTIADIAAKTQLTVQFVNHVIARFVSYKPTSTIVSDMMLAPQVGVVLAPQVGVVLGSKRQPYYNTEQEMLTKPQYDYEQVQHER
jgi:hypothetical protein